MPEEAQEKVRVIIEELRKEVIPKNVSPIPEEVLDLLKKLFKAHQLKVDLVFGGSWAKNTYLEGDHDIDIFVRFDMNHIEEGEDISDLTGLALASMAPIQRIHGSRDYFQFETEGYHFEIVPVEQINNVEKAENSTDASPFHVAHVREAIAKNEVLASDIRIAKLFCKTAGVYGAESYLNGFSGHVLDNLLIHYGDILRFFSAVKDWDAKGQVFIDAQGQKNDGSHLNDAKKTGPLILLDPIQTDRNAAAALGREKYVSFISTVKRFLEKPSKSFFKPQPVSKKSIEAKHEGKKLYFYELLPGKGSKDVAGTKLLKCHEFILRRADEEGFSILEEGFDFDGKRALCFIVVEEEELSPCATMIGPLKTQEAHAKKFSEKHKDHDISETSEGRLSAVVPRTYRKISNFLKEELQDSYVKSRSQGLRIL